MWHMFYRFLEMFKPETDEKTTQTVIHVRPHVLVGHQVAKVTAERTVQTKVVIKPQQDARNFYSMLEYTPFQDISEDAVRILDLPRKKVLNFRSERILHVNELMIPDDDGLADFVRDIGKTTLNSVRMENRDSQTGLRVHPHILPDQKIATVLIDAGTQTCC